MARGVISYIRSQIKQIREDGSLVLLRKLYRVPLFLLAIPVVFLVRILRPWVIVRFGALNSERIGHFAGNTEIYLCKRDLGMYDKRCFDIFYYNSKISNYQLKKMWDRTLRINQFAKWAAIANLFLPGAGGHIVPLIEDLDAEGLLGRISPHLYFTPQEEEEGKRGLEKFGIINDKPFVCFLARDPAYLTYLLPRKDWRYQDYRDCNISDYFLALEELTRRGYFALRMGKFVKERLVTENPKIIDYATGARSDLLDIYLASKCRFFISSGAGIDTISAIFRKPIVYINLIPFEPLNKFWINSLIIPKKLWLKEEKRFLTFREILNSDVGRFRQSEEYKQRGIEVVDNTPQEINSLVIEMYERLEGRWRETEEDQELQQRFWSLFNPKRPNQAFAPRIGTEFLRQNRELLELDEIPDCPRAKEMMKRG